MSEVNDIFIAKPRQISTEIDPIQAYQQALNYVIDKPSDEAIEDYLVCLPAQKNGTVRVEDSTVVLYCARTRNLSPLLTEALAMSLLWSAEKMGNVLLAAHAVRQVRHNLPHIYVKYLASKNNGLCLG